jgi:hypothetical protein
MDKHFAADGPVERAGLTQDPSSRGAKRRSDLYVTHCHRDMPRLPRSLRSLSMTASSTHPFESIALVLTIMMVITASAVAGTIRGVVRDFDSGDPVSYVTVLDATTGQTISANKDGEYRLRLAKGTHDLKFSRLAYYSERMTVDVPDSDIVQDVSLKPMRIEVPGITVSARAYGPGQRIILEAIRRKADILSRIKSYTFKAYTKMVIREEGADDSTSIAFINEAQQKSYWEQPDKYKTIVTAQRHSENVKGIEGFGAIENLLNFNQNRA